MLMGPVTPSSDRCFKSDILQKLHTNGQSFFKNLLHNYCINFFESKINLGAVPLIHFYIFCFINLYNEEAYILLRRPSRASISLTLKSIYGCDAEQAEH